MKFCGRCQETKPLTNFGLNKTRRDGRQSECFDCRREINREYYQRTPEKNEARRAGAERLRQKNREVVKQILQSTPCVDCGNDDWRVLEFDHVYGDKAIGVSDAKDWATERLVEEIAKCVVRCANCHRIVTSERGGFWRT